MFYSHRPLLDSTFQESPMRPVPSNFRTGQHTHNNDHTVRRYETTFIKRMWMISELYICSRQEGLQKSGLPRWRPGQTPVTGPTTGQHSMIGRYAIEFFHINVKDIMFSGLITTLGIPCQSLMVPKRCVKIHTSHIGIGETFLLLVLLQTKCSHYQGMLLKILRSSMLSSK